MRIEIISWCEKNGVTVKHLTPYQTRLSVLNDRVCDVYWKNKRYHIIKHPSSDMVQQRGNIPDVETFLESIFK